MLYNCIESCVHDMTCSLLTYVYIVHYNAYYYGCVHAHCKFDNYISF